MSLDYYPIYRHMHKNHHAQKTEVIFMSLDYYPMHRNMHKGTTVAKDQMVWTEHDCDKCESDQEVTDVIFVSYTTDVIYTILFIFYLFL